MRKSRAFTLIELLIVVTIILVLVAIAVTAMRSRTPPPPPPAPVKIPTGSKVEATGDRIVEILRTDETEEGLVKVVGAWVQSHPDYRVETITPAHFSGGGDYSLHVRSYLIVAERKAVAGEEDEK